MGIRTLILSIVSSAALCCGAMDFTIVYTMTSNDIQRAWETWPIPVDAETARQACEVLYTNRFYTAGQFKTKGDPFKPPSGPRAGQTCYPYEETTTGYSFVNMREIVTNTVAGDVVCGWCFDIAKTYHVVITANGYPYSVYELDKATTNETTAATAGIPVPQIMGTYIEGTPGNCYPEFIFPYVISSTVRTHASYEFKCESDADWGRFTETISDPYYRLRRLTAQATGAGKPVLVPAEE